MGGEAGVEAGRSRPQAPARRGYRKPTNMKASYGSYIDERDLFASAAIGSRSRTATLIKKKKGKQGVNSVSKGYPKETALHTACTANQMKIVALLIKRGAKVDKVDEIGNTAMHRCARWGNVDCARMLLNEKEEWQQRNMDGFTALQIATKHGHQDMVMLLHA